MIQADGLAGEVLVSVPEDLSWDLQHPHKHQVRQHVGVTQVLRRGSTFLGFMGQPA